METTNASSGISRRRFLKIVSGIFTFIGSLILAIPLAGFIIGPISRISKTHFSRVANLKNVPQGTPTNVRYPDVEQDAYIEERMTRDVWVIKHSADDVTVFSPICPHLGCSYNWNEQKGEFICPCHGSVFAKDGKVLAGPAPRPLDTLPKKSQGNELLVEWEQFEVGIPQKIKV
jgi:menaquinol-cytochrome c reductase iron-sulfur subunit